MFCRCLAADTPPSGPTELLTMPTGLQLNDVLPEGGEPTSMAFFSTPGIERLYSGVTNRIPFDCCSFSRNDSQSGGGFASRSWLKKEMPCGVMTSSFSEDGASLASALATFSEKLSLRRLPAMVTTV